MKSAAGGIPPAPAGYAFAGTIVALKNGTLVSYALYTKN